MATEENPLEEAARQLLRKKVGYPVRTSMRQLDQKLGRHLGYTSRLLTGESRLRLDHVSELLEALDLDAAEFLRELAGRLEPLPEGTPEAEKTERAVKAFFRSFDPQGYIRKLVRDEVTKAREEEEP